MYNCGSLKKTAFQKFVIQTKVGSIQQFCFDIDFDICQETFDSISIRFDIGYTGIFDTELAKFDTIRLFFGALPCRDSLRV